MKIGIASPCSLRPLADYVEKGEALPQGYAYPQTALIIKELVKHHEVTLFTLDQSVQTPQVFRGENLEIHIGRYRAKGRRRASDFFRAERADLLKAIAASDCELIHAHWTYEFALAALASKKPSLVTVRDWAPQILMMQRKAGDIYYRFMRLLMAYRCFLVAKNFTVASPYMEEKVAKLKNRSFPIIPNALPDELFLQREKQLEKKEPLIVSVNNGFGQRKNVTTLLKAFAYIRKALPLAKLLLIGRGYEEEGPAFTWAKREGLAEGVSFLGKMSYEEVMSQFAQADLLIHPSLEESFGMTLVEAMSQKAVVIAGKSSGAVPWVLDQGKAGLLVDVKKSREIAQVSVRVLSDEAFWAEQSMKGFDHAYSSFTTSQVIARYLAEYEKVLSA